MKLFTRSAATLLFASALFSSLATSAPTQPTTVGSPPVEGKSYSPARVYNLGNANARAGNFALAVLNYERERLMTPNDPDLDTNLRVVRGAARLPPDPPVWWEHELLLVSPTLAAWAGVLGIVLLGGGLVWGSRDWGSLSPNRLQPRPHGWRRLGILAGVTLLALTLAHAYVMWPLAHQGVVLTAATPVRVTPVPMGDPAFVLEAADTVRILAQHEDFFLIRTRTQQTGWVSAANLAAVVPR